MRRMNVREEEKTCRQVEGKLGLLPTNAKKKKKKSCRTQPENTQVKLNKSNEASCWFRPSAEVVLVLANHNHWLVHSNL